MKVCPLDDCDRDVYVRGFCERHYKRFMKYGDPRGGVGPYIDFGKTRICDIETCDKKHAARGYCATHYRRWRLGKPLETPVRPQWDSYDKKIEQLTRRDADTGCLLWLGRTANGYGRISLGDGSGTECMVHRAAYEKATGETLKSYEAIHHKCAVRNCIEPAHLQKVSIAENNAEMMQRRCYLSRISDLEDALAIYEPDHDLLKSRYSRNH